AAEYNALEAVKQIIRNGADVNAKHPLNGYNALISASEEGHTDIVLYLLNCSGIDVNAATGYGRTALYCAALYGYEDIVQGLLGCSILKANVKDFYDATPLILAAKNGHHAILLLLLERGDAELNATCFNIETDGKPTMPEINFDGHTALFWAALGGHTKTVSALLE
ncbi:ankyrin repeat-containing domain protein, partial [Thelonectria olida]